MAAAQLVTIGQIAAGLQISRQRADRLSRQAGFPSTASESVQGRKWYLEDVKRWAAENGRNWQGSPDA
jgi:predicted DNA-binding transcriptional regulator AlpA